MRLEGLLLKSEFRSNCDVIGPDLDALIDVCEKIMCDEQLKEFLRFVLHAGNFINNVRKRLQINKLFRELYHRLSGLLIILYTVTMVTHLSKAVFENEIVLNSKCDVSQ